MHRCTVHHGKKRRVSTSGKSRKEVLPLCPLARRLNLLFGDHTPSEVLATAGRLESDGGFR
jgi:hypothetical protein